MNVHSTDAAAMFRQARLDNPKMRERDLAQKLGISEAELLAAHCGHGALRIDPDVDRVLNGLKDVGEVMALTRNASAVHEKIGIYEKIATGPRHALVLGSEIDLRIFPEKWAFGFAVEKDDGKTVRRSLQFFDRSGDAVHKVHLRPASDETAYRTLVEALALPAQAPSIRTATPTPQPVPAASDRADLAERLRERWAAMTDVHQFFGVLRELDLTRHEALRLIGEDYAWQLDHAALAAMLHHLVQEQIPMMCFVGNNGCIQIHSGPIFTVKPMGPWINVLDPRFNLHLRTDHVAELWAVRKPVREGHVTSIEAFASDGELIAQFFGQREEGRTERSDWRMLVEHLPYIPGRAEAAQVTS